MGCHCVDFFHHPFCWLVHACFDTSVLPRVCILLGRTQVSLSCASLETLSLASAELIPVGIPLSCVTLVHLTTLSYLRKLQIQITAETESPSILCCTFQGNCCLCSSVVPVGPVFPGMDSLLAREIVIASSLSTRFTT